MALKVGLYGIRLDRILRDTTPARPYPNPIYSPTLTMFFNIYKVFWSFLYDFYLLNPNALSASRKRLSNFVQTQKTKMAAKTFIEAIQIAVSAHPFSPHG